MLDLRLILERQLRPPSKERSTFTKAMPYPWNAVLALSVSLICFDAFVRFLSLFGGPPMIGGIPLDTINPTLFIFVGMEYSYLYNSDSLVVLQYALLTPLWYASLVILLFACARIIRQRWIIVSSAVFVGAIMLAVYSPYL